MIRKSPAETGKKTPPTSQSLASLSPRQHPQNQRQLFLGVEEFQVKKFASDSKVISSYFQNPHHQQLSPTELSQTELSQTELSQTELSQTELLQTGIKSLQPQHTYSVPTHIEQLFEDNFERISTQEEEEFLNISNEDILELPPAEESKYNEAEPTVPLAYLAEKTQANYQKSLSRGRVREIISRDLKAQPTSPQKITAEKARLEKLTGQVQQLTAELDKSLAQFYQRSKRHKQVSAMFPQTKKKEARLANPQNIKEYQLEQLAGLYKGSLNQLPLDLSKDTAACYFRVLQKSFAADRHKQLLGKFTAISSQLKKPTTVPLTKALVENFNQLLQHKYAEVHYQMLGYPSFTHELEDLTKLLQQKMHLSKR